MNFANYLADAMQKNNDKYNKEALQIKDDNDVKKDNVDSKTNKDDNVDSETNKDDNVDTLDNILKNLKIQIKRADNDLDVDYAEKLKNAVDILESQD